MTTRGLARFYGHDEAAECLGISRSRLYHWRVEGQGPKYYKIGKSVFYDPDDIDAFLKDHYVTPTRSGDR